MEPEQKKKKQTTLDMFYKDNKGKVSVEKEVSDECISSSQEEMSPDIFADSADEMEKGLHVKDKERVEMVMDDKKAVSDHEWRGASLDDLQKGDSKWGFPQLPPVSPSSEHTVLFQLPISKTEPQRPHPEPAVDVWDSKNVRMPCSCESLCPVEEGNKKSLRIRWEIIQESLLRKIVSSHQLEAAILSYNSTYSNKWDFSGLHYFLSEVLDQPEADFFFSNLLPDIIQLALQLPNLITRPIPLLEQNKTASISLSQQQISCLLANAFLCTFPRRNSKSQTAEFATYPEINFNRMFQTWKMKKKTLDRAEGKLKCMFNYFRRVCRKVPNGVVTFKRQYIPTSELPVWENSQKELSKLRITSTGTIEDDGDGMLQMDFANKYIGGGVLGWGCVQEEIRFVICPELIASCLFMERMDLTEAIIISGCERFSSYSGYGDTFEWIGDFDDETPCDSSGRRLCTVVAVNALRFRNIHIQFAPWFLVRELNKAYAGFYGADVPKDELSPVATGNWGCGVYRGNPRLKVLLQLMAATEAGRDVVYFTFNDSKLRDDVHEMYTFLKKRRVTVGQLWSYLCTYYDKTFENGKPTLQLYQYLHQEMGALSTRKNVNGQTSCAQRKADGASVSTQTALKNKEESRKEERDFLEERNRLEKETIMQALDEDEDVQDSVQENIQSMEVETVKERVQTNSKLLQGLDEVDKGALVTNKGNSLGKT